MTHQSGLKIFQVNSSACLSVYVFYFLCNEYLKFLIFCSSVSFFPPDVLPLISIFVLIVCVFVLRTNFISSISLMCVALFHLCT